MRPGQGAAPSCPSRRAFTVGALASIGLAGCSSVQILNTLAPDRLAAEGIPYGSDPRQRLDVYRPVGIGRFPVMMFLYGGGWKNGAREMYRFVGGAFAASGILTVIPDYRLYPQVRYREVLADCVRALAWTRANAVRFGGDEAPPALIGHSAGAYNAAMLALDAALLAASGLSPLDDLACMIGLAGPYDFLPLQTEELRQVFGPGPATAATQPITYADGRNPPMLLLAGTADTTVRPDNTTRLASRIRSRGGPVEARLYDGVGHIEIVGAIAASLRLLAPTLPDCLSFLQGCDGLRQGRSSAAWRRA